MQSPRRLVLVGFAFLALTLWACSKPEPPTITPESATVSAVSPKGMTVRVVLDVYNPNDIALSVQKVTANITLGKTVEMGPVGVPSGVRLPAGEHVKVTVNVPASWQDAAEVAALAAGSPTIPLELKGKAEIGGKRIHIEVPFAIQGTVTRQQLVGVGLRGLPQLPGLPDIFGR